VAGGAAALATLARPWSALGQQADPDGRTAGRVLDAAALLPATGLRSRADWSEYAGQRLSRVRPGRRDAFVRLRRREPNIDAASTRDVARALAAALIPGYKGPGSITATEADAEAAAVQQRADKPDPSTLPVGTGSFTSGQLPPDADVRRRALRDASQEELDAARLANTVLDAAGDLVAPDLAAVHGQPLTVPV
jgi:hypothetical protein